MEYGVQRETNQEVIDMIIDEETQKRWDTELHTICSFCEKEYTFSEYMNSKSVWIDPKKKQYGKKVLCECGVDLFSDRWQIISKNGIYIISTVHLSIAHAGVEMKDWMDYGFWYETMFWSEQPGVKNKFGDFQMRYHTREEAVKGQEFTVKNLNKILENPDKHPQGIMSIFFNSMKAAADQRKNIDPKVKRNLT